MLSATRAAVHIELRTILTYQKVTVTRINDSLGILNQWYVFQHVGNGEHSGDPGYAYKVYHSPPRSAPGLRHGQELHLHVSVNIQQNYHVRVHKV